MASASELCPERLGVQPCVDRSGLTGNAARAPRFRGWLLQSFIGRELVMIPSWNFIPGWGVGSRPPRLRKLPNEGTALKKCVFFDVSKS